MPLEAPSLSPWFEVLGRLHPVLLHFPIALLLTAALLELLGGSRRSPVFVRATLICLAVGTLGAGAAAASGWYLAEFRSVSASQASTLMWHRWGGLSVAGGSLCALLLGTLARDQVSGFALVLFRGLLLAVGVATGLVAHLGGNLTWGADWLSDPLGRAIAGSKPELARPSEGAGSGAEAGLPSAALGQPLHSGLPSPEGLLSLGSPGQSTESISAAPREVAPSPIGAATSGAVERSALALEPSGLAANSSSVLAALEGLSPTASPPTGGELSFERDLLPLLSARCVECHGPQKTKADLRLDSRERLFAGEPEFWVVRPGDPAASLLLERVRLPEGDPDQMPPKGARLSAAEIELLERWIAGLDPSNPGGVGELDPAAVSALGAISAPSGLELSAAPQTTAPLSNPEAASVAGLTNAAPKSALAPASGPPLPPADPSAVERWLARGARILPLAEGDGALELSLARLPGKFEPVWLADLAPLSPQLVWLDLSGVPVEDAQLAQLRGLNELEHLRLDATRVTNLGLIELAELPALRRLNLCSTAIDDGGLERFVQGFASLQVLYLWNSRVSKQGAAALEAQRPGLRLGPVGQEPVPAAKAPEAAESGQEQSQDE